MSARRLVSVAALLTLPALTSAQGRRQSGGGSGGSSTTYGGDKKIGQSKVESVEIRKDMFSVKDLQKENMVAFVLDKKKDLKLSDDEVKALKEINDRLEDSVKVPMKALDSISTQMRRTDGGAPDQSDRAAARIFGQSYMREVRAQYDAHLALALAKLADDHQKAANEMIGARRKELAPPPEKER